MEEEDVSDLSAFLRRMQARNCKYVERLDLIASSGAVFSSAETDMGAAGQDTAASPPVLDGPDDDAVDASCFLAGPGGQGAPAPLHGAPDAPPAAEEVLALHSHSYDAWNDLFFQGSGARAACVAGQQFQLRAREEVGERVVVTMESDEQCLVLDSSQSHIMLAVAPRANAGVLVQLVQGLCDFLVECGK
mmetsp:Transcript_113843/g.322375  ORF Transcript_113843/g.322375 Transcript_113843/m.322375 type:complete len:190 (-) Transcript_113843:33-602(-)